MQLESLAECLNPQDIFCLGLPSRKGKPVFCKVDDFNSLLKLFLQKL